MVPHYYKAKKNDGGFKKPLRHNGSITVHGLSSGTCVVFLGFLTI